MSAGPAEPSLRLVGRYALLDEIASGGMATVHLGRAFGSVGFSRIVAIKRLHASFAKDPGFVAMFVDEARLAARIRHPNVVPILDVVTADDELFLVLEYVEGEALSRIFRRMQEHGGVGGVGMPPDIAASIVVGALHGLHAAHEAKSETGEPLRLVHRDVSPHNILVGADGVVRVFDFGIAKAVGRLQTTQEGQTKGKLAYMSPEQARAKAVDRRTDVYAASVVLWEALAGGRRLFEAANPASLMAKVLAQRLEPPSSIAPAVPAELDRIVMRGLATAPDERFATALEMAVALEEAVGLRSPHEIGRWLEDLLGDRLRERAARVAEIESGRLPEIASAVTGGVTRVTATSREPKKASETKTSPTTPQSEASSLTQATEVVESVVTETSRPAPSKMGVLRKRAGILVLVTCVAGGVTTAYVTHASRQTPAAGLQTSGSGSVVRVAERAPAESASAVAIDTFVTTLPTPPPPPSPSSLVPTPTQKHALSPTTPRTRVRAVASCDPPFTVDANGVRHPRAECLSLTPVAP